MRLDKYWHIVSTQAESVHSYIISRRVFYSSLLIVSSILIYSAETITSIQVSAFISIIFGWITYKHVPISVRILIIGTVSICAFYILVNPSFLGGEISSPWARYWLSWEGKAVVLVASAFALVRPSFALIAPSYIVMVKGEVAKFYDLSISQTDYLPVIDVLYFVTIATIIYSLHVYLSKHARTAESKDDKASPMLMVLMFAVGIHFSNYVYSGLGKLALDGGISSWIVDNEVQHIVTSSFIMGLVPIGHWPELTYSLHTFLSEYNVTFNAFVLLTQLAAVVCVRRVWTAIGITIIYDLVHIGIFLASGIFFWKWILLNAVLIAAFKGLPQKPIPWPVAGSALAAMLLQSAVFVDRSIPSVNWRASSITPFFTAVLAWYDTRALTHQYFTAVTADGREVRVPTNFFLDASITFGQGRGGRKAGFRSYVGHYTSVRGGGAWTTNDYQAMQAANRCDLELPEENHIARALRPRIAETVRKHHSVVMDNLDDKGRIWYDLFPHHIFSNPFEFKEFFRLDKKEIVGYRFHIDSVCVKANPGSREFDGRVEASSSFYINVAHER